MAKTIFQRRPPEGLPPQLRQMGRVPPRPPAPPARRVDHSVFGQLYEITTYGDPEPVYVPMFGPRVSFTRKEIDDPDFVAAWKEVNQIAPGA